MLSKMIQTELFPEFYSIPEGVDTRQCNKCNKMLPISCFSIASGSNYYRPECRRCNNELRKVRDSLKQKTPPPLDNHQCPICGKSESDVIGKGGLKLGAWVLDHCHMTDKARGWLCHPCNRSIGCFQDDVNILKKAINYLQWHS